MIAWAYLLSQKKVVLFAENGQVKIVLSFIRPHFQMGIRIKD